MKSSKLIVASTVLAVGLASATAGWAKPGAKHDHKSNHGQTVSSAAKPKDCCDKNHGQKVSEVARAKSSTSGKHHDKAKGHTKTRTTVQNATHTRNAAIQAAQRTYWQRRAQILNDGDSNDSLTSAQRRALADATQDRNRAIRQAQEQYRLTVR